MAAIGSAFFFGVFIIVCITVVECTSEAEIFHHEQRLKERLFQNYDKKVPPQRINGAANNVSVGLSLINLHGLDEKTHILTMQVWFNLEWNDTRLRWEPREYDNISVIRVPDHEIWQPDIRLYTSGAHTDFDSDKSVHTLIYQNGVVIWIPPAVIHTLCPLDLRYYPFDQQNCTLKFGSWTYDGFHLNTILSKLDLTEFYENPEWIVEPGESHWYNKYYDCCVEPYTDVRYSVILTRRPMYYVATLLIPVLSTVVLTLLSFTLPWDLVRLLVGFLSIALTVYLLTQIASVVPISLNSTPMIVYFTGSSAVFTTISIILSVYLYSNSKKRRGPNFPPTLIKTLARFAPNNRVTKSEQNVELQTLANSTSDASNLADQQWDLGLYVLNRIVALIVFLLYLCLFIASFFQ